MIFSHGNRWIPLLVLGLAAAAFSRSAAQTAADYGSGAPTIEADRVLSFAWPDVDKYPVITSMAFVPGGKQLLTGGDDCRISLWNLENGALEHHFLAHEDWVRGVAVSPDGSLVASVGQDGTVKLWNRADLSLKATLPEKVTGAQGFVFSPSGKVLAVSGFEDHIALFDVEKETLLGKWKMPGTSNTVIRYSPDGSLLAATGRSGIIRIWDAATMKVVRDLNASKQRIHDIAFSPDGTLLTAGGEETAITVWDVAAGSRRIEIPTTVGKTFSLCFCGNGLLASGDSLNMIRLWDVADAKEIGRCPGHSGTVAVMRYDAEKNELASGGFDTTVRFWPLGETK